MLEHKMRTVTARTNAAASSSEGAVAPTKFGNFRLNLFFSLGNFSD